MDVTNIFLMIAIIARLTSVAGLLFLILPRQYKDIRRNGVLKELKLFLFGLSVFVLLTMAVPIVIHICRLGTIDLFHLFTTCQTNEPLIAGLAAVSALNGLAVIIVLYLIYHTKYTKHIGGQK